MAHHSKNLRRWRGGAVAAAITVTAVALSGCAGSGSGGSSADANTLTLWHYESATSAMGMAWNEAVKVFQEENPGITVNLEEKGFEQIRSTASQVLNSDEAPDVMEYNKGNATAGLLASQGLLTDISDAVQQYGWDQKLAPSLQTTAKYTDQGIMGGDAWYGIPNYGEFVTVYYNKDMFAAAGLQVPTTYDEFVKVMDAFVAQGVTPLAEAGAEYPLGQLWYQLALTKANRQWVDDYQLYKAPVDWQGAETTYASTTLKDYVDAGYISKDVAGMKAEDAGTAFIAGQYPIFVSGSWWYGRFINEMTGADWGIFNFPGTKLDLGSSGNLWVVPENAKNKDAAYKFIDITMRPEIQAIIGNNGGLPVAADAADITDPKSQELIAAFTDITDADGLAFYPDWPTPTFYDTLVGQLQNLVNGTSTPEQVNTGLGDEYESYVSSMR
jgi:raffinose/stachyose/melibiose transport system substrate-binding protein